MSIRYVNACVRDLMCVIFRQHQSSLSPVLIGMTTQEGKFGEDMYFVISGMVEVLVNGERLGFLAEGAFFGKTSETLQAQHSSTRKRQRHYP